MCQPMSLELSYRCSFYWLKVAKFHCSYESLPLWMCNNNNNKKGWSGLLLYIYLRNCIYLPFIIKWMWSFHPSETQRSGIYHKNSRMKWTLANIYFLYLQHQKLSLLPWITLYNLCLILFYSLGDTKYSQQEDSDWKLICYSKRTNFCLYVCLFIITQ